MFFLYFYSLTDFSKDLYFLIEWMSHKKKKKKTDSFMLKEFRDQVNKNVLLYDFFYDKEKEVLFIFTSAEKVC